jgi:hypothetical protein
VNSRREGSRRPVCQAALVRRRPHLKPNRSHNCDKHRFDTPNGLILASRVSAASRDLLNPLLPPGWRLEGIGEILCLVHDLTVAELHNAHRVCQSPLASDCVFRDREIIFSENSLGLEAGRLAGMMTPQGLQIASPEDSLARLGIITNGVVIVDVVLRVCLADRRRVPVF